MKTLRIGIASYEDMKARTMAIARGKLKPKPGDPKVWFTSTESFAKVLSNKNRALLATIASTHPVSLAGAGGAYRPQGIQSVRHVEDNGALIMASCDFIGGSADGSGRKCPINRSLSNSLSAG